MTCIPILIAQPSSEDDLSICSVIQYQYITGKIVYPRNSIMLLSRDPVIMPRVAVRIRMLSQLLINATMPGEYDAGYV